MYKSNSIFQMCSRTNLSDTNDVFIYLITVFYLNIKYIILHIYNNKIILQLK